MGDKKEPQAEGPTIRLAVIPEPEEGSRSVLVWKGKGTVAMRGPGNLTMVCGNCAAPLIVGWKVQQLHNIVFKCAGCAAYNETVEG